MGDIWPQSIYCPFLSEISPHHPVVEAHTLAWGQRFRLIQQEDALNYYRMVGIPELTCRFYPRAGLEELCLASDWALWMFVYDDLVDDGDLDYQSERLLAIHTHFLAVINDPAPSPCGPIAEALVDIFQRAGMYVSSAWRHRFTLHHAQYFAAQRWQIAIRTDQHWPTLEEHIVNGVHATGVFPPLDLIEIAQQKEIPQESYTQQVQSVLFRAGNIISLTNDAHSFKKDPDRSDPKSVVLAVQRERQCKLQEAIDYICAMIAEETRAFESLTQSLPAFHGFWEAVAMGIQGHLTWYSGNSRYIGGKYPEPKKTPAYLDSLLPTREAEIA